MTFRNSFERCPVPDSPSSLPDVPAPTPGPRGRRRFTPLLMIAGLASAVVLSLSMTNTFSAFTAAITNTNDTAAAGTLILQESNPAGVILCNSNDTTGTGNTANSINTNSANCASFNKYGGSTVMVPSATGATPTNTVSTTVTFKNTGTAAATAFTLAGGTCTQVNNGAINGSANDFCGKLRVVVTSGATAVYAGTAAALATATVTIPTALIPVAGGPAVPFTFQVYLDSTAGNTYQGLGATQPLVWTLTS